MNNKIAKNLEAFSMGIERHNVTNPTHNVYGIGLNIFDIDRLELEVGEEIFPGVCINEDDGITMAFRILCDGDHSRDEVLIEAKNTVDAIGDYV